MSARKTRFEAVGYRQRLDSHAADVAAAMRRMDGVVIEMESKLVEAANRIAELEAAVTRAGACVRAQDYTGARIALGVDA